MFCNYYNSLAVLASYRGAQYVYCMMHKCIMVKIGGSKKPKLNEIRAEIYKFCGYRGSIYKFCENREEYTICFIDLRGDG